MKNLGFGCMRLPLVDKNDPKSVDFEETCKMTDEFLAKGFTYFDTAYMYHEFESENFVRKCLVERHPRDSYVLASKLPTMMLQKPEDMERIFNEQLEKCGVDYFDYYLVHNLGVHHYEIAKKMGAFDFVRKLKKDGLARKIGFSFHDRADVLEEILRENHEGIDFIQLQINYIDWDSKSIQARQCHEVARKYNLPIIVMEPVKGGALANVPAEAEELLKKANPEASPASWAIRFAAGLDGVFMVLSGMSNTEQMRDNMNFMSDFQPLSDNELDTIWKTRDIINQSIAIPCTSCEYCVPGCPKNIPIPKFFSLYNNDRRFPKDGWAIQHLYYENYIKDGFGKASDCIACRKCEKECPQHIEIVNSLKTVATRFENE